MSMRRRRDVQLHSKAIESLRSKRKLWEKYISTKYNSHFLATGLREGDWLRLHSRASEGRRKMGVAKRLELNEPRYIAPLAPP
jgi:hypothetical protein